MSDPRPPSVEAEASEADRRAAASVSLLSETELAVIRLLATGASNREIAHERGISEATVKKHVTNINGKIGTSNRVEITRVALAHGLVDVDRPPREDDGERERATRELAAALERERHRASELETARARHRRRVRWLVGTVLVLGLALLTLAVRLSNAPIAAPLGQATPPVSPGPVRPTLPLWVPIRVLPEGRSGLALGVAGGSVHAIGGWDGARLRAETLRFEPEAVAWRALAEKPTPVRDIRAVELRGRLIVPGGCDAAGEATTVVEAFEPGPDRWRSLAPLPSPRCAYALAVLQGQLYLFGGREGVSPETVSDDVLRYDPETDVWTTLARLPSPRGDLAAAAVGKRNEIHVVGGRDRDGDLEVDHWIFRPFEQPRWDEAAAPLPEGRAGHAMVALDSPLDRLYVVGGGWDAPLEDDAGTIGLTLEDDAGWVPFARVPGPTPRRGAGLALLGRTLFLAGGDTGAGQGPSRDAYRYETFTSLEFR